MSEFFRGRRMDRAGLRQASANYAVLPDEQYERLENIGHLATLAWREGYAAFGERPQRRPGLDNSQADRAGEVVADLVHSRAFDVLAVRDFETELRLIRRHCRSEAAKQKAALPHNPNK